MLKKILLLAALAATCASAVLSATAVADPQMELNGHTTFSVSGGAAKLETGEFAVECTSVTGSGKFENNQTGTITLTYHGCELVGTICTTPGQSNGTITTTELPFHLKSATEEMAVLITPSSGYVTTFECVFGLVIAEVSGSGLIGLVTSPAEEEESSMLTIDFGGEKGAQDHTAIDGEEAEYNLAVSINGGTPELVSVSGEDQAEFAGLIQIPRLQELGIGIIPIKTGTVKSKPVGIDCVIACKSLFMRGEKVELEAVPAPKQKFKEWNLVKGNAGNCMNAKTPCELILNNDAALIAVFE